MPGMRRGKGGNEPDKKPYPWYDAPPHPAHFGLGPEWEVTPPRPGEPEAQYHRPPFGAPVTEEERAEHASHGPGWYMRNGQVNNHICIDCGRIHKGKHKGKRVPVFRRPNPDAPSGYDKHKTFYSITPEGILYDNPEDVAEMQRQGYDHNYSGSNCPRCYNEWLGRENAKREQAGKPPINLAPMPDDEDQDQDQPQEPRP